MPGCRFYFGLYASSMARARRLVARAHEAHYRGPPESVEGLVDDVFRSIEEPPKKTKTIRAR